MLRSFESQATACLGVIAFGIAVALGNNGFHSLFGLTGVIFMITGAVAFVWVMLTPSQRPTRAQKWAQADVDNPDDGHAGFGRQAPEIYSADGKTRVL